MKIVLGEKSKILDKYAEVLKAIPASEMCGIKFIKEEVDLFIISRVLDNGFIENTSLNLEEVLITLKVRNVYYKFNNTDYLINCSKFYQVKIYTEFSV